MKAVQLEIAEPAGEDDRAQGVVTGELVKGVEPLLVRSGEEAAAVAQVGGLHRLVAARSQRFKPGFEPRRVDFAGQRGDADTVADTQRRWKRNLGNHAVVLTTFELTEPESSISRILYPGEPG